MTIVLTFKTSECLILATDSRLTIREQGQPVFITDTCTKLFQLTDRVGVMTCGTAFLGGQPIDYWLREFKATPESSVQTMAQELLNFLPASDSGSTSVIVSGYEPQARQGLEAQIYKITRFADGHGSFFNLSDSVSYWDGEFEAISRLMLGRSPQYTQILSQDSTGAQYAFQSDQTGQAQMRIPFYTLNLAEGVRLARFLVNLQIEYQHFTTTEEQSTAPPVVIAAITPWGGFRWIDPPPSL